MESTWLDASDRAALDGEFDTILAGIPPAQAS